MIWVVGRRCVYVCVCGGVSVQEKLSLLLLLVCYMLGMSWRENQAVDKII